MQVESIKERLPGTERLVYAGKDLDDGSTLAANGIPKEGTLEALGRLFGGGKGSGGGASKPTKGVAAGRRALTAIMATRKMQAGADASEGAEGSNQAVGGAASAADARRQTTTSDADALAAKDREIAALQRRIDEFELLGRTPPQPQAQYVGSAAHTAKGGGRLRESTNLLFFDEDALRVCFEKHATGKDAASSPGMSKAGLGAAMKALRMPCSDDELDNLFEEMDLNKDKHIQVDSS